MNEPAAFWKPLLSEDVEWAQGKVVLTVEHFFWMGLFWWPPSALLPACLPQHESTALSAPLLLHTHSFPLYHTSTTRLRWRGQSPLSLIDLPEFPAADVQTGRQRRQAGLASLLRPCSLILSALSTLQLPRCLTTALITSWLVDWAAFDSIWSVLFFDCTFLPL